MNSAYILIGIVIFLVIIMAIKSNKHLSADNVMNVKKDIRKPINLTHKDVNGTIIGIADNKLQVITDEDTVGHGGVWGGSGSGKTTLLMNFIESCCQRELPLIYVDGKGDIGLPGEIKKIADLYNRQFYHFSIKEEHISMNYNPLALGSDSTVRDKLINLTKWSEQHYKVNAERAIMLIVNILEQLRKETESLSQNELLEHFHLRAGESAPFISRDLINIKRLLNNKLMRSYINFIQDDDIRNELDEIAENMNVSWYEGLESRLALLAENFKIKNLLKDNQDGIDLLKAIKTKSIVVFSLDSLNNKSATEMLGSLIVNDVNAAVSKRTDNSPAYAIYDEHGAYISEEVESQFAMARSFGLRIISSTQEISDYERSDLGDILKKKVIGNTNFKVIMAQSEPENTSYISEAFGTKTRMKTSMSTDKIGEFKGLSFEEVEEFVVHPNLLKNLERGHAVLVVKMPKKKVVTNIKVRKVGVKDEIFKC